MPLSSDRRSGSALVAKIKTPRAVRNLPDIIVQAAGRQPLAMMIARDDLAIELGFEPLAESRRKSFGCARPRMCRLSGPPRCSRG